MSNGAVADQESLISSKSIHPAADTITKIVKRIRALTIKLLPLEIDVNALNDPTSRIITPDVIKAYSEAAGDFTDTLPYCLLRARWLFIWDANHDPADYGENMGRAAACEILARRIVHSYDVDRLNVVMSERHKHLNWDGTESVLSSALESAVDQHCTIFLSSNESQLVVNSLWRGDWIQRNNPHGDIEYIPYARVLTDEGHVPLDPSRLNVPRYQSWFRMFIWILFLFVYSHAVQQPVEHASNPLEDFDAWEVILYVMGLAYAVEDVYKIYRTLRFFTWKAFDFWVVISLITDALLITAFSFRVGGLNAHGTDQQAYYKLKSFQILACVSPFIWMKIITVLDGFQYVGTMQICVSRMLQESSIFLGLLSILGIGFAQSLYALDAADGQTDHAYTVVNRLIQALLQSPDFGGAGNPIGLVIYYMWSAAVTVILLNILISLFSSAYNDITEDAAAEYLTFFAEKTIDMIRAPDDYVFPAPFNLIETLFVVPFEFVLSKKNYAKLSRRVMLTTFWPILLLIHFFETNIDSKTNRYLRQFLIIGDDGEEDDPAVQDPTVEGEENDMQISRVSFDTLLESFPNTYQSPEANILAEIRELRKKVEDLSSKIIVSEREGY